jgi:hypothetical protein
MLAAEVLVLLVLLIDQLSTSSGSGVSGRLTSIEGFTPYSHGRRQEMDFPKPTPTSQS